MYSLLMFRVNDTRLCKDSYKGCFTQVVAAKNDNKYYYEKKIF